jgi:hypothetical protein
VEERLYVCNLRVSWQVAHSNRSANGGRSGGTAGNGSETTKIPARIGELNDREIGEAFVDGALFVPLNAAYSGGSTQECNQTAGKESGSEHKQSHTNRRQIRLHLRGLTLEFSGERSASAAKTG